MWRLSCLLSLKIAFPSLRVTIASDSPKVWAYSRKKTVFVGGPFHCYLHVHPTKIRHFVFIFQESCSHFGGIAGYLHGAEGKRNKKYPCKLATELLVNKGLRFHRSDEGLTLETSAFKLLTVTNLRYQLSRQH